MTKYRIEVTHSPDKPDLFQPQVQIELHPMSQSVRGYEGWHNIIRGGIDFNEPYLSVPEFDGLINSYKGESIYQHWQTKEEAMEVIRMHKSQTNKVTKSYIEVE